MFRTSTLSGLTALAALALTASLSAQAKGGAKPTVHDLTIKGADGTLYTGTMQMAADKGKVTGTLLITKPTEVKGTIAGTTQKGAMALAFPYTMTERKCEGTVKMDLKVPAKPGPLTGTMEAIGCGRDATNKMTGTVELVPVKK